MEDDMSKQTKKRWSFFLTVIGVTLTVVASFAAVANFGGPTKAEAFSLLVMGWGFVLASICAIWWTEL